MINLILEKQNPWWRSGELKHNYFSRFVLNDLIKNLENDQIIALAGSRQVGKTAILYLLIDHLLKIKKENPQNILYFNLDDLGIRELFGSAESFLQYLNLQKTKKYIFIDEIQRLPNPGLFLKTIYDLKLPLKLIVSGSSQLELKSKLKEFLVGRLRQFEISRLSFSEVRSVYPNLPPKDLMAEMMIYGAYPAVIKQRNNQDKQLLLRDIYQNYIEKDISDFAKIENIDAFNKLLILLAAQNGGLLNINNLAKTLKISASLIGKYLDILEGTFIIKRIYPFFSNYKKEISKTSKVYFLDLGLRNFILNNWQMIDFRQDKGLLFENLVFLEIYSQDIYKLHHYHYWRTTNQTEIDFIIEDGLNIKALECKYDRGKNPKSFATFKKYYPKSKMMLITVADFLTSLKELDESKTTPKIKKLSQKAKKMNSSEFINI